MRPIFPPPSDSDEAIATNLARLKELFPELVTEGKEGASVNVDVLKQLVGDNTVTDAGEKFGLNWFGKRQARQLALTSSLGTLRPAPDESVDWDTTKNLMIEGDNLEVLKLLQKSYAGKLKLIYIDPPYNTGNDFVYPDDFSDGIRKYKELTGQTEDGKALTSNAESSGRFHTTWLNMMYPRLKVARNLLQKDGIFCISMDDHEIATLRMICDDIFGEESFVGTLTWTTTTQPDNIGKARFGLQQNIEYVLMYSACPRIDLPPFVLESKGTSPKYPHQGKFGPCRFEIIERAFEGAYARRTMRFKILGQEPRPGKQWQIGEELARELEARERVEIVEGVVKRAVYPEDEAEDAAGLAPFWANLKSVKTSQRGKAEVTDLLGSGHGIDTVKPVSLLKEILKHLPKDGIILDFFAGSGTTGHAVLEANAVDGGLREFIIVQLPQGIDPSNPRQASSAEFCDSIGKPRVLTELTKERLRRAGTKVKAETPDWKGDTGFRVFKLDSSNIRTWDPNPENLEQTLLDHVTHLKPDRSEADIFCELLLRLGIDLTSPIEEKTIAGKSVRNAGKGILFACLTPSITRKDVEPLALGIADWRKQVDPTRESTVVFRDDAFADEASKANLTAILRQHGFHEKRIRSL